jgi:hypothetical protein
MLAAVTLSSQGKLTVRHRLIYVGSVIAQSHILARAIMRPCFMAGKAFAASMLDTVISCYSYVCFPIYILMRCFFSPIDCVSSVLQSVRHEISEAVDFSSRYQRTSRK